MNCNKANYIANKNITYREKEIFKEFITLAKQEMGARSAQFNEIELCLWP